MNKIVTIGGGTGLSVLLRGMKKYKLDLTAVVSVADDGGNSGMLRNDLDMLPPGDIRNCLLALASEEDEMQGLLTYRFKEGQLEGQNIGNLIIAAAADIYGSFEEAVVKLSRILKVQGTVLPVTSAKIQLAAELENGNIVIGESQIPVVSQREGSAIKRVFLEPNDTHATEKVLSAIRNADIIFLGPGSFYTSIIPNLLVGGVREAINSSRAKTIYICNLMTQPGETDRYTADDHIGILANYIEIDYALVNDIRLDEEVLAKYRDDNAEQIIYDEMDLYESMLDADIELIMGSFVEVRDGLVRHNVDEIVKVTQELF